MCGAEQATPRRRGAVSVSGRQEGNRGFVVQQWCSSGAAVGGEFAGVGGGGGGSLSPQEELDALDDEVQGRLSLLAPGAEEPDAAHGVPAGVHVELRRLLPGVIATGDAADLREGARDRLDVRDLEELREEARDEPSC